MTCRPDYQHPWGSKTYYRQLRLDPLVPANATVLLQALVGHDASMTPLMPVLIGRTEGNPLFLEESVRSLQLLAEVYGWFSEGFDTADLQEARALLDALC